MYTPRSKRNKLEANAQLGILVGYVVRTKRYRVWLLKSRQVIESVYIKIEGKNGVDTLFGKNTIEEDNNNDNHIIEHEDYGGFNDEIEKDQQNENITNQNEQIDN